MTFLIDNQLPAALATHLRDQGLDANHVLDFGLESASDQQIWDYAKAQGYTIVTKDEDFSLLSSKDPSGPIVVWIRIGNCRNTALFAAFDNIASSLQEAIKSGAKVIEIR